MIKRPETNEFPSYYLTYVSLVPEGDIRSILNVQLEDTISQLKNISEEQGQFRYATGKWSIKEVLGHMIDTECIMAYRLLCFSRGETISLPGFDEKLYVANAFFDQQSMADLLEHLSIVRQATLLLLKSLNADSWNRKGRTNNAEVSVRGLAYIIAGHAMHHGKIIKERYLESSQFPA